MALENYWLVMALLTLPEGYAHAVFPILIINRYTFTSIVVQSIMYHKVIFMNLNLG